MTMIESALLIGAVGVAAVTDIRTRRIPNLLTAGLAILALVAHLPEGWNTLLSSLSAAILVYILGAFAYHRGIFGGGDVKLMAAATCAIGAGGAVAFVLYTLIAGGVVTLIDLVRQQRLRSVLDSTTAVLGFGAQSAHSTVPYGVAIALGAATSVLATTVAPFLRLPL
jgi:prepilin peptidase CpaA